MKAYLQQAGIRVEVDSRNEKLGYRMRESQTRKIPFTLVLGDKEKEDGTVSYRRYGKEETTTLSKEEFLTYLKEVVAKKEK